MQWRTIYCTRRFMHSKVGKGMALFGVLYISWEEKVFLLLHNSVFVAVQHMANCKDLQNAAFVA